MTRPARRWGWIALAALLSTACLSLCVRIVPADTPGAGTAAPVSGRAPVTTGPLLIPVDAIPPGDLIDTFTQAREEGARPHDAIDIMAARGKAVVAAAPGRIEKLFWSLAGGRTIYERSADGRRIYYYAHLEDYAPGLREGQPVRRGQRIGSVGSTGNASPDAPHLHFAVHEMARGDAWYEGRAINPYPLLARAQ